MNAFRSLRAMAAVCVVGVCLPLWGQAPGWQNVGFDYDDNPQVFGVKDFLDNAFDFATITLGSGSIAASNLNYAFDNNGSTATTGTITNASGDTLQITVSFATPIQNWAGSGDVSFGWAFMGAYPQNVTVSVNNGALTFNQRALTSGVYRTSNQPVGNPWTISSVSFTFSNWSSTGNFYLSKLSGWGAMEDFLPGYARSSAPTIYDGMNVATGNVGIGTVNPVAQLHVEQNSTTLSGQYGSPASLLLSNPNGNTGVGGTILFSAQGDGAQFTHAAIRSNNTDSDSTGSYANLEFLTKANTTDTTLLTRMTIDNNGNVGIGTNTPGYLLDVAGTIGAQGIIVYTPAADYVFDPGYKLTPLSEVSEFIQQNHHLPEIPSAKEVQEKGVNLGEMQTKLLAKIEELTLHMIQDEEENRQLRERIERLEWEGGSGHEK